MEPGLFIAFPCLNPKPQQWANLEAFIREFTARARASVKYLVVDDGSSRWVDPPSSLQSLVSVHRLPANRGKGGALKEAVSLIPPGTDVFAFMDFDLPFRVDELLGVCSGVLGGSDFCIGDRTIYQQLGLPNREDETTRSKGADVPKVSDRASRNISHRIFRLFVRMVITGGVFDTQCGIKAYNAEAIRWVARKAQLDGFLFDIEWLYIAAHHRLVIRSWPVAVDEEHASSSLRSFWSWRMVREFFGFLLNIVRRRYNDPDLARWVEGERQAFLAGLSR